MRSLKCLGCGAPVPFDPEEIYTKCRFCGTEVKQNLSTKEIETIRLINKKREKELNDQIRIGKRQILFEKYKNLFLINIKRITYISILIIIAGILIPRINSLKETKLRKENEIKSFSENISNDENKFKISSLEENDKLSIKVQELTSASPSLEEIRNLIDGWLQRRSNYLAGKSEINLSKIISQVLIDRIIEERKNDINNGIYKEINSQIRKIDLESQTSSRIVVLVELNYLERIVKNSGEFVNETSLNPLKVKYIFGFSNKSWKLVDFVSGL